VTCVDASSHALDLQHDRETFHATRVLRNYKVRPFLAISASAAPSLSLDQLFTLDLELTNLMSPDAINIRQITTISPSWRSTSIAKQFP
jgi:hypothetical protein